MNFKYENGYIESIGLVNKLHTLDDKSVDLILAYPPYCKDGDSVRIKNCLEFSWDWLVESRRVLRDSGKLVIVGSVLGGLWFARMAILIEDEGFFVREQWGTITSKFRKDYLILSKDHRSEEQVCDISEKDIGQHFIDLYSTPGELVLIPFIGAGHEVNYCKTTNRRFIGIDKDDTVVWMANEILSRS